MRRKPIVHFLDALALASLAFSIDQPSHGNAAIFAFFVAVYAAVTPGTWLREAMQWKLLRAFGVCCYSVYLFHALILFWFRHTSFFKNLGVPNFSAEFQMTTGFVIVAAVTYLVGLLSFRLFELPCVKFGKAVISKLEAMKTRKGVLEETSPEPATG